MPTAPPLENASTVQVHRQQAIGSLLILLAVFLVLYWLTAPPVGGDTLRYAADTVAHAHGNPSQFWVFGHLLWRPWGYIGFASLCPWFERHFGDTEVQAVARFLICTNFVCCLLTIFLVWDLMRRLLPVKMAAFVTIGFCGANCFLAHIKLGTAHLPGLFFECLTLWLLVKAVESTNSALLLRVAAGLSFAVSVLLWFPYIIAGLGMLFFLLLWPLLEGLPRPLAGRAGLRSALEFILAFGISTAVVFAAGAAAAGVHDSAGLIHWVVESGNGWSQHLGIIRAATGIPRMLYELESGNILLKRWFFHDPYNPVHLSQLAGPLFLKLVLFYVGIASLLAILLREKGARAVLALLLVAEIPLLFFAIFVFEPGSPDRYLPGFPFLYIAAAVALCLGVKRRLAYAGLVVLLASTVVFNAVALGGDNSMRANAVRRSRQLLDRQIASQAVVFVPTLHDDFYYVPLTHPIDHTLASRKYEVMDVVETASVRVLHWRAEFADRALRAWQANQEIWISGHVLAPRPERSWPWVEGDDPRIRWSELPQFFHQFELDGAVDRGNDGFVRIANAVSNRVLLERVLSNDPGYSAAARNAQSPGESGSR